MQKWIQLKLEWKQNKTLGIPGEFQLIASINCYAFVCANEN